MKVLFLGRANTRARNPSSTAASLKAGRRNSDAHKLRKSSGFDPRRTAARDVMTPGIHCCREDDDLAKAVRHMEELKIRRLPVINKSKRMVGILSLGDVSHSAPLALVSECVKSVATHH